MTDAVLASMLDRSGTLVSRTQTGAADRAGNPTWENSSTTVDCYVEQTAATEVTIGETTEESSHLGVFPSGIAVDGAAELVLDGVTYEFVGDPWRVWEPGSGESHVEARLRVVS